MSSSSAAGAAAFPSAATPTAPSAESKRFDKDRTAALLATLLGADLLLYLTDVPAVADHWGTAFVHPLERATPRQLRSCRLDEDTMGLEVESACRFVEQTGHRAAIGALSEAAAVCAGTAGTQIVASELASTDLSAVPGAAAR